MIERKYQKENEFEPDLEADIEEMYREMVREQLNSPVTVLEDDAQIKEKYLKVRESQRG